MPPTAATALVLVIAVVPGSLGSYLFSSVNGLDWRERDRGAAIRYVAFSGVRAGSLCARSNLVRMAGTVRSGRTNRFTVW